MGVYSYSYVLDEPSKSDELLPVKPSYRALISKRIEDLCSKQKLRLMNEKN